MTRFTQLFACLIAALCTQAAFAQVGAEPANTTVPSTSTAPVAYVYVSTATSGEPNLVWAFAAAPDARLTVVKGSPFTANVVSMAVTGKYLFGTNTNGTDVDSFSIAPDGALKQAASINALSYTGQNCNGLGPLILDHTGASLYVEASVGGLCGHSEYLSFTIDKSTGELKFLGSTAQTFLFNSPLSFLANNAFAYGTDCINFQGNYLDTFAGLRREGTGLLTYVNVSLPTPAAKNSGDVYCRDLTAADPSGHLAVSMQAISGDSTPDGAPQLAAYTADKSGNLTTKSTFENMPTAKVLAISTLAMSPSGKLLAVAGAEGLEVFHFNGSNPITHYTGVLNNHNFSPVSPSPGLMFWDSSNHLYAITPGGDQELRAFTVTPSSASEAAGSPYSAGGVRTIAVLPRD
jgi:hypothetical protein